MNGAVGPWMLFFSVLFVLEGLLLGCTFFVTSENLRIFGSSASFLRTSFTIRLVKSVHIGLNKTFYIYYKKYIYFHVLGVLVMDCFGPLSLMP